MKPTQFPCSSRAAAVVAALTLALSISAHQANAAPAIVSFSGGSIFTGFSNNETVGWRFEVDAGPGVTVTSLGWWDQTSGTPLAASHQVGIWDVNGTLLGSVTVQPNSTLNGAFRYQDVVPFNLMGGATYIIGGVDLVSDGDNYITSVANLVTDPLISFTDAARSVNNSGFAFPTIFEANSGGRFGPNFLLEARSSIPEPGTLALFALVLAGLAASRRRKHH